MYFFFPQSTCDSPVAAIPSGKPRGIFEVSPTFPQKNLLTIVPCVQIDSIQLSKAISIVRLMNGLLKFSYTARKKNTYFYLVNKSIGIVSKRRSISNSYMITLHLCCIISTYSIQNVSYQVPLLDLSICDTFLFLFFGIICLDESNHPDAHSIFSGNQDRLS